MRSCFERTATVLVLSALLQPAAAQNNAAAQVQQQLASTITLSKLSPDHQTLLSAGTPLVLHAKGLALYQANAAYGSSCTFKDGTFHSSAGLEILRLTSNYGSSQPNADTQKVQERVFQEGETLFVTGFHVQRDSLDFELISDVIDGKRYRGTAKFSFKGQQLTPELVASVLQGVFSIDAASAPQPGGFPAPAAAPPSGGFPAAPAPGGFPAAPVSGGFPAAPAPPAGQPAANAFPAPPPSGASAAGATGAAAFPAPPSSALAPPGSTSKTVRIGQPEAELRAVLGDPDLILDRKAAGKTYVYNSLQMKILIVNGKVAKIQ